MMNYDIHWNPVRLMQRIGRVDRRMSPEVENRLLADHPEAGVSRGKVWFWNFLPPEELNAILSLYARVTQKTLLISETLGIEGKKLLTPEDNFKALKDFNHAYEGTRTAVEEMHLEYQALLQADPALEARLARFPGAIFSGRKRPAKGVRGVFFCYALPALDKDKNEFTEEAGTTRWYLYDLDRGTILQEPGRDRRKYPLQTGNTAALHRGGDDAPRHPQADREACQEQLPQARGRADRREAAAALLDGAKRRLSRCRPTTANDSLAYAASISSSPTCVTNWVGP